MASSDEEGPRGRRLPRELQAELVGFVPMDKLLQLKRNCVADGGPRSRVDKYVAEWLRKYNKGFVLPENRWNAFDQHGLAPIINTKAERNILKANKTDFAGSARAVKPLPITLELGTFYFEIKIRRLSYRGGIAIGLSNKAWPLTCYVGYRSEHSIGYHFDGDLYWNGKKMAKLAKFGVGDVVGCGVRLASRKAFFTRNGELLAEYSEILPPFDHPITYSSGGSEKVSRIFQLVRSLRCVANSIDDTKMPTFPTVSMFGGASVEGIFGPSGRFMFKN